MPIEFVANWFEKSACTFRRSEKFCPEGVMCCHFGARGDAASSFNPILPLQQRFYQPAFYTQFKWKRCGTCGELVPKPRWPLIVLSAAEPFHRDSLSSSNPSWGNFFPLTEWLRRTIGLCDKLLRGLDQFELHAKLNWPQSQFPSIDTVPTLCICGTIWENLVQTENGIWENGPDMGTRRHIFPIICTNLWPGSVLSQM